MAAGTRSVVNNQRDDAVVDQVTVEAQQQRDVDIALAAQLGAAGYRMRTTPELGSILTNTSNAALSTALPAALWVPETRRTSCDLLILVE